MFARRYKSYAWALLVGRVLGCSRPRWPATLNPTNSARAAAAERPDRKSTRLNSSHDQISYAVFCLKKKTNISQRRVTGHPVGLDRGLGKERLRADFPSRHLDVVERDAATVLREFERDRPAEAGRAARHDDDSSFDRLGGSLRLGSFLNGRRHRVAPARRPGVRARRAQGVRTYVRT